MLGATVEFSEFGPWTVFNESNTGSPLYNQAVYFDANGNEFVQGSGPQPGLVLPGTKSNALDFTGAGTVQSYSSSFESTLEALGAGQTTGTPAVIPAPSTSTNTTASAGTLMTLVEGSLIGGIPNWLLAAGVAGVLLVMNGMGKKHHGR